MIGSKMRTLLGLCIALFSLSCSCKANPVCSVPDTKKAYVTTLAINMGRSVAPCVPPDPSVLLALNLGQTKDPTAQAMLVKQLKQDAAEKLSKNQPFSSGKVALYVLALRSSCADLSIPISGGSFNLVTILEQKTEEELKNCGASHHPLTTWYEVALDALALCVMSRPAAYKAARALADGIGPTAGGSVDTAAVAVMALTCVHDMQGIPPETLQMVKGSASSLLNFILASQNNGLIGNEYSTGLAGQALTAARALYTVSKWDCAKTLSTVLDLIPSNTFSLPIAAAQVLPLLSGKSYVSVKGHQCPQDTAPMISVVYTIVNELVGTHFQHSVEVQVSKGSTLLQVMEKAAQQNPNDFSFHTETSSWGAYVSEINHLAGSTNDKTYWQFFKDVTSLPVGVGQYIPENGEHILAVFSTY